MKILLVLVLLIVNGSCFSQKNTAFIEADIISSIPFDTMFLVKGIIPYKDENLVDAAIVENGKIKLQFEVEEASYYILRSAISKGVHLMSFVAAPGERIAFKWSITSPQQSDITFTKSKMNKTLYNEVTLPQKFAIQNLRDSFDSLYGSKRKLDNTEKVKFGEENKFWSDSLDNIYQNYIRNYPKEFGSLFFLNQYHRKFSDQFVADLLKRLPKKLKNHTLAQDIAFKKFTIAKINNFSQFSLVDSIGKTFDYTSYNHSIVLVDFWASWCKPCLENIPKVDALRLKFESQGLKVLGISIDENKDAWLKALQRENLPWQNVLEPKAMKGMTPIYFNISTIPRYVLLGKNGVILNKDIQLVNAAEEIAAALKDATVTEGEK